MMHTEVGEIFLKWRMKCVFTTFSEAYITYNKAFIIYSVVETILLCLPDNRL